MTHLIVEYPPPCLIPRLAETQKDNLRELFSTVRHAAPFRATVQASTQDCSPKVTRRQTLPLTRSIDTHLVAASAKQREVRTQDTNRTTLVIPMTPSVRPMDEREIHMKFPTPFSMTWRSTVRSQARNAHTTRLAQELHCHLCAPEKNLVIWCSMSHPLLRSHLPFTTSASSSSFTFPSTTKQEHAAQSGHHDHLQEHPVRHEHLQALPVDKQRHQVSLWRENLQSGGNPRTTTPTGYEPKELATQGSKIFLEIHISYMMHMKEFGEQDHRAPITEKVKEFGVLETRSLPDSQIPETSHIRSKMHFDVFVESTADSDLEDGELQKMLTSPLCARKASGKPDAMVMQEREVSAQFAQANRSFLIISHSTEAA